MEKILYKPLKELTKPEALIYLNRWAKYEDFYYEDRNLLYKIKENYCSENLGKTVKLDRIIKRDNPTIEKMKVVIQNKGQELEFLDIYDFLEHISPDEKDKLDRLQYLVCFGYNVYYSEAELKDLRAIQKAELARYEREEREYEENQKIREPILEEYKKQKTKYYQERKQAAIDWAKTNNFKLKRHTKSWIKKLEKKGFDYGEPPKYPFKKKLSKPQKIKPVETFYEEDFENYQRGTNPEVEELLTWIETIIEKPIVDLEEIDDSFVCHEIEGEIRDRTLEVLREKVVDILKGVVRDEEMSPEEIYNLLTAFPIDYEDALGLQTHHDFRNHITTHKYYSKWHEINLSPKGYWLIELSVIDNPEIVFHIPYNNFINVENKILTEDLEVLHSNIISYGRGINDEEMEIYPIEDLVEIFGYEREDFPNNLEEYISRRNYYSYYVEDDEDDEDDDFVFF